MTRIEYYCSVTQKRIIGLTKVTMTELDMMVRITYGPIITYKIIVIRAARRSRTVRVGRARTRAVKHLVNQLDGR